LPYIKPQGGQINDEMIEEYLANKEAKQAELREQKES